jgi:hypothetical protein
MAIYFFFFREQGYLYRRVPAIDLLNRLVVAAVLWTSVAGISRSRFLRSVEVAEQKVFILFLSHVVTITVIGGAFLVLFGTYATYWYLLLLGVTPAACYASALFLHYLLAKAPGPVQKVFSGKLIRDPGSEGRDPDIKST